MMISMKEIFVSLTTHNLQNWYSEAKNIRFYWKDSKNCIFRGHIATAFEESNKTMIKQVENCKGLWRFVINIGTSESSYYVPMTLPVLSPVSFPLKILASPKSDILGFMSLSSKMLLAFRSLWIILSWESWWRYRSPRAIPLMIWKRLGQSSNLPRLGSATRRLK